MVLQILPDPRQIGDNGNAVPRQYAGGADAREHQDLRGADCSGAQDDLPGSLRYRDAPAALVGDPCRPLANEGDLVDQAVGLDGQIRALHRGLQECIRGAPAPAVALRDMGQPNPVLGRAIDVVDPVEAQMLAGSDERLGERIGGALARDVERTTGTVERGIATLAVEGLALLEVRQHVVKAPARVAELAPLVVVARVAAHIHHGVHRRGAAENLAARPVAGATARLRLGLGQVVPVEVAMEQLGEGGRDADFLLPVGPACLEQENTIAQVLVRRAARTHPAEPAPTMMKSCMTIALCIRL